MCSGFFTGNKQYMALFCDYLLKKATEVIEAGYGHADEQFYSQVYFDHPEIFDTYYGDYPQMITNYRYIRDDPHVPIGLIIHYSYVYGDYAVCIRACKFVMNSFVTGKCQLGDTELHKLGYYFIDANKKLGTAI
jgi:hypothetical protein